MSAAFSAASPCVNGIGILSGNTQHQARNTESSIELWRVFGPALFLGGFGARQLGGSQARRLFHDPLGFLESPDHAANALWVADLVVLKAIWSIGELDRTHFIAQERLTMP